MKVLVSKSDLVALIGKVQGIVSQRPALPILSNILIEASSDQLTISATDLVMSIKAHIPAKITEEGAITLPARRFFQLVRELTTTHIEIHTENDNLAILVAGSSEFKIHGMASKEFPAFPEISSGTQINIPSILLKEMFTRTSFAAAKDDSRHILNGVQLNCDSKELTFIGTDGKRLAKLNAQAHVNSDQITTSVIPLKAVEEMNKLLDQESEEATLSLMSDKVALEVGPIHFVAQVISGQYPDVNRVIPEKQKDPIALHREELMTLLRQVALFTSDQSSSVRFTFSPGMLNLAAMSGDIGEGKVSMPVNYKGDGFQIAFNPNYFIDILKHIKDEAIDFSASSAYNPGLITDSSNATFVIMPMRLDS